MRHSPHPALTSCRAPLPPGKKYVSVKYLTNQLLFFVIDAKGKCHELIDDACKYLGLQDPELFGLALLQDGEYIFLDPNLKISKYAVRSWKVNENGTGSDGLPLLTLHMRVKYYVDCHLLINEKVVRHHYYLQLRENVRNYCQALSEEKSFLLAALALQADLGNYTTEKHMGRYFEIHNYFPSWIVHKIGEEYIFRNIPALHKDNVGLSRGEAQVGYIKEASDETAPHNLHFYRMRRKKGKMWNTVWLGIKDSGINIYEEKDPESKMKSILSTFLWCDIAKLHFEKKKFEIQSEGCPEHRRFTYYVNSEDLARHILSLCRNVHHFHMSNQGRVQDLKKLELEGGKPYRESYIYTDKMDQAWEKSQSATMKSISDTKSTYVSNVGELACISDKTFKSFNRKENLIQNTDHHSCSGNTVDMAQSAQHRSMEALPLTNGCLFSSDVKFKSQSISCFADRSLAPCTVFPHGNAPSRQWTSVQHGSLSVTPTSTLLSRSSYASCADSACSSLSLTSGSTIKANPSSFHHSEVSQCQGDDSQWVKCDSFEDLSIGKVSHGNLPHKVFISTFANSHVRTTSLYDVTMGNVSSKPQVSKSESCKSTNLRSGIISKRKISNCSEQQCETQQQQQQQTPYSDTLVNKSESEHIQQNSLSNKPLKSAANMNLQNGNRFIPQNPNRHYFSNAPTYSRTVTRIGVSSLNREQRLPLALFNENRKIIATGSEPNLYNSSECDSSTDKQCVDEEEPSTFRTLYMKRPNSRSEMCLNTLEQYFSESLEKQHFDITKSVKNSSKNLECSDSGDNFDFPCIPPPPAYRNISENGSESIISQSNASELHEEVPQNSSEKVSANLIQNSQSTSENHKELRSSVSLPPDVLDLHQLRQKSRDLDLPLISALCNDRSLLMLPKTVPTCSRQRHLGNKDYLRFCRSYGTAVPNRNGTESGTRSEYFNGHRPVTWHADSAKSLSWSESPVSCNGGIVKQNLPPTILTSFGKTPEKVYTHGRDNSNGSNSSKLNKNQMIPTKLLSDNTSNGRLYQKGSSS